MSMFSSGVLNVMQQGILDRVLKDALIPELYFYALSDVAEFPANVGETIKFSKAGLISPTMTPRLGVDPTPKSVSYEQFELTANDYADSLDVSLALNAFAVPDLMLTQAKRLGFQASLSLERLVRNTMFRAYNACRTNATALGSSSTSLPVSSINGFTHALSGGVLAAVSASNPLAITIGASTAASVTAVTPSDTSTTDKALYGPGTLTLAVAKSWSQYDTVVASDAPFALFAGTNKNAETLAAGDYLTLALIRKAVAKFRSNYIPAHDDGLYHLYISPNGMAQLQYDSEFRALFRTPTDSTVQSGLIDQAMGVRIFSTPQSPCVDNYDGVEYIGGIVTNHSSVDIGRAILTGKGVVDERYIPPSRIYGSLDSKLAGKWADVGVGAATTFDNKISFILRPPLNRMGNLASLTWTLYSGFACQPDLLSPVAGGARHKRAMVIYHSDAAA